MAKWHRVPLTGLLLAVLLPLGGCAADHDSDAYKQKARLSWLGHTKDEVRKSQRSPSVVTPLQDGREEWTYIDAFIASPWGQPTSSSVTTIFVFSKEGKVVDWKRN